MNYFMVILLLSLLALYYGYLVKVFDATALRWLLSRPSMRRYVVDDLNSVINIGVASIFQVAICVVLVWVMGLERVLPALFFGFHPVYLIAVPVFAISELSFAALICALAMQVVNLTNQNGDSGYQNWLSMMNSGWLRSFTNCGRVLPTYGHFLLLFLYIGTEEILFRLIALRVFQFWGDAAALILSSALFILIQAVGMPSFRHALFPVMGATVMGPVHAYLALKGVPISVLIFSHLLFFYIAVNSPRNVRA